MNRNVLSAIRNSKGFSRSVVILVIVAIVGIVLERSIYYSLRKADIIAEENAMEKLNRIAPYKAKQLGLPTKTTSNKSVQTNDSHLSETLAKTQDALDVLTFEMNRKGDTTKAQDALNTLYAQMLEQDKQAMADFEKVAQHIYENRLSEVIKGRHDKAVKDYRKEMDTLLGNLRAIKTAEGLVERQNAVKAARKHLEDKQFKRTHQSFDPDNMPNKSIQPNNDIKPKLTPEEFVEAGLHSTPYAQYAALGDFTYGNLSGASNPAYLAETTEVKITQSIRDKAQELEYDPVRIYNWVRNNVEWLPTWGAMQDADITLGSLRGNAMDISSLLIALLRASQIPARYAHGTIYVPSENFMNWVGPFTDITAAANLAGTIPRAALVRGGKIQKIRMEHIWVEAAIDYHPSRGSVNKDADSWVALDASYKQYETFSSLDIAAIANLDAQTLVSSFAASGTTNEAESWVAGFDPTILDTVLATAQTAVENYITSNLPNATVGDVIGGRRIIPQQAGSLPSSLPHEVALTGARYSELPAGLQAWLSMSLGSDIFGQPNEHITVPWASINNHKLTLSFKPSTSDDEAALQSYIPTSEITSINQLPSALPAYLIRVIPEIKLDGQVIKQGESLALGQEVEFIYSLGFPNANGGTYRKPVAAGSFMALHMFAGSISGQRLTELQTKITQTKTILDSNDPAQIDTITREDLIGDMFHAGVLANCAQKTALNHVIGQQHQATSLYLPSGGTFGYSPKVNYFFTFPRSIQAGGIEMDLKNTATITSAWDGDAQKKFSTVLQTGVLGSSLEHAIPEQMFVTSETPGEAVSAVKLLSIANAAGQQIYHITKANQATTLPNLNLSPDIISDIQAGLNAGKEIITHTDNLAVGGYTGAGYIIFDPEVGDGAYIIGGGLNGAVLIILMIVLLVALIGLFMGTWLLVASVVAGQMLGSIFGAILAAVSSLALLGLNEVLPTGLIISGLNLVGLFLGAVFLPAIPIGLAIVGAAIALADWILNIIYATFTYTGSSGIWINQKYKLAIRCKQSVPKYI